LKITGTSIIKIHMEIEYNEKKILEDEKKFFQLIEELTQDLNVSKYNTTTNIAEIATLYTYIKSSKVVQMSHIKPLILAIYNYERKQNLK
jgi:predicted transcriptional regulator